MGLDSTHDSHADLNRLILEAVLRDFEPFETILDKIAAAPPDVEGEEIRRVMLEMLADDLVGAYLIHADPPYFTPMEATPETIDRYWFLITEKGKRHLQEASERRARVLQE